MAFTVVGTATDQKQNANLALTLPTITGPCKGLMVLGKNTGSSVVTTPAGWTLESNQTVGTTLDAFLFSADLDVADSGATVNVVISGTQKNSGALIVISGANATLDGTPTFTGDNANTNTSAVHPSYTPTAAGVLLVALIQGQHPTAGTTWTPDADYTSRASVIGSYATPVQSSRIGTRQITGGAGTPVTGDADTWNNTSREAVWVVGLAPAATGVTGSGTFTISYALTGAGIKAATAAGTITLGHAITGVAVKRAVASGTLGVAYLLGGTGSKKTTKAGTLGVSYALTGAATKKVANVGTLGVAYALGGTGTKKVTKTGTLTIGYALTGAATKRVARAGTLGISYTLGGVGLPGGGHSPGSGTITIGYTLTGVGRKAGRSTGTLGLSHALTGVGRKRTTNAGGLTVGLALAGSGRKTAAAIGTTTITYHLDGVGSQVGLDPIVHRPHAGITPRPTGGTIILPDTGTTVQIPGTVTRPYTGTVARP